MLSATDTAVATGVSTGTIAGDALQPRCRPRPRSHHPAQRLVRDCMDRIFKDDEHSDLREGVHGVYANSSSSTDIDIVDGGTVVLGSRRGVSTTVGVSGVHDSTGVGVSGIGVDGRGFASRGFRRRSGLVVWVPFGAYAADHWQLDDRFARQLRRSSLGRHVVGAGRRTSGGACRRRSCRRHRRVVRLAVLFVADGLLPPVRTGRFRR